MIYFITGNENKFKEALTILPDLEQLDIDLPEIQELNSRKIIEAKLLAASEHHQGSFVVEDTSLRLDCLGGLPGPFIKWFEKTVGLAKLAQIAENFGETKATTTIMLGYRSESGDIEYFEGTLSGTIVQPRGDKDFGWGPIFQPDGHDKTFGEMDRDEKNSMSMRKIAFQKLKNHLNNIKK